MSVMAIVNYGYNLSGIVLHHYATEIVLYVYLNLTLVSLTLYDFI